MSRISTLESKPGSEARTIRIAAVGCGIRAAWMLHLMTKEEPNLRVDALIDPDPAAAQQRMAESKVPVIDNLPIFSDVEEYCRRPVEVDGILVGTRCREHAAIAAQLAKLNVPLFLEKPVAISWRQLSALRTAFSDADGEQVVISFPLRRTPLFDAVIEMLRSGRCGAVNQIQAVNFVSYGSVYVDEWYRDYDTTGGLWLQKATHDFDYLHLLADAKPLWVTAMHTQAVWRPPVLHQDSGSAMVQYDNGLHVAYSQNFLTRRDGGRRGARITGQDGTLEFDWVGEKLTFYDHTADRVDQVEVKAGDGHGGGDQALARNFLDVILGRAPSLTPLSVGLLSAATCLAARDAAYRRSVEPIPAQTPLQVADSESIVDTRTIEPPLDIGP